MARPPFQPNHYAIVSPSGLLEDDYDIMYALLHIVTIQHPHDGRHLLVRNSLPYGGYERGIRKEALETEIGALPYMICKRCQSTLAVDMFDRHERIVQRPVLIVAAAAHPCHRAPGRDSEKYRESKQMHERACDYTQTRFLEQIYKDTGQEPLPGARLPFSPHQIRSEGF